MNGCVTAAYVAVPIPTSMRGDRVVCVTPSGRSSGSDGTSTVSVTSSPSRWTTTGELVAGLHARGFGGRVLGEAAQVDRLGRPLGPEHGERDEEQDDRRDVVRDRTARDHERALQQRLVAEVGRVLVGGLPLLAVVGLHAADEHVGAERDRTDHELGAAPRAEADDRGADAEHAEAVDLHARPHRGQVMAEFMEDDDDAQGDRRHHVIQWTHVAGTIAQRAGGARAGARRGVARRIRGGLLRAVEAGQAEAGQGRAQEQAGAAHRATIRGRAEGGRFAPRAEVPQHRGLGGHEPAGQVVQRLGPGAAIDREQLARDDRGALSAEDL
jgi:hypothetical protein